MPKKPKTQKNEVRVRIRLGVLLGLAVLLIGMPVAAGAQDETPGSGESLDAILKDLSGYDFAVGVGAPMRLKAFVLAHKDDPTSRRDIEEKILSFIQSEASAGGKMEACRSLRIVGGSASIPVLGKMLIDPETTDMARFVLEKIPGEDAEKVLLAALEASRGAVISGIVFSLGERGSPEAVSALGRLVSGKDPEIAVNAAQALGRIGGSEATKFLMAIFGKAKEPLKSGAARALLVCAEKTARSGMTGDAALIYDHILASKLTTSIRQAAFSGKIMAAGGRAQKLLLDALSGRDPVLYGPAIAAVPKTFPEAEIGQVVPFLSKLPESGQVQLIAVLAGYPGDLVRSDVLASCENASLSVRLEALRVLEKIGNASVVGFLARRAALTRGEEQVAAREALARIRGLEVDTAILERLSSEIDDDSKSELVQASGSRRIAAAKPILLETVKSGSPTLRLRAIRSLKDISSQADISDLLGLLFTLEDDQAREEMQDTIAAVAGINPRPLARGNVAEALLAEEPDPRKKSDLLRVLGKIGDDSALPLVRRALEDPDESVVDSAVRALAEWPTASARDDVYEVARNSMFLTHRVLALRAYVRMIGLEPYRAPDGAVSDLHKVLSLATRPEEKRLILGMLPRFPCVTALKTAESLISDESVWKEATLAADRIRTALTSRR